MAMCVLVSWPTALLVLRVGELPLMAVQSALVLWVAKRVALLNLLRSQLRAAYGCAAIVGGGGGARAVGCKGNRLADPAASP